MLKILLGSKTKELLLLYLYCYECGYAREISRKMNLTLSTLQKQLKRLENAGIIIPETGDCLEFRCADIFRQ